MYVSVLFIFTLSSPEIRAKYLSQSINLSRVELETEVQILVQPRIFILKLTSHCCLKVIFKNLKKNNN
jgi:hypothetical protein